MRFRILPPVLVVAAGVLPLGACQWPPAADPVPVVPVGKVLSSVPDAPDRAARYALYLHSIGLDRSQDEAVKERFHNVTRALADHGLTVIAEIRSPGTIQKSPEDLDRYARRVAAQVRTLLAAQVPPANITVVGYSRGGVMALMASGFVDDADVGYAILAGSYPSAAR